MGSAVRNAVAKALAGIKAYHSSPHDFDKFSASKIGTGEGAQVYGHGLYFAENPAVSGQGGEYWNQFSNRFKGTEGSAATLLKYNNFDRERAIAASQKRMADIERDLRDPSFSDYDKENYRALLGQYAQTHKLLESGKPVGPRTYEVNIAADPVRFLDWDKQVGAQSGSVIDAMRPQLEEVRARANAAREVKRANLSKNFPTMAGKLDDTYAPMPPIEEITGKRAYEMMGLPALDARQGYVTSAARLGQAGVPGIRYLDEGSRAASVDIPALQMDLRSTVGLIGQLTEPANIAKHQARAAQIRGLIERAEAAKANPTSNYVMFPGTEHLIDITKKYAVPGAIGTGTMGAVFDPSKYTAEEAQR